MPLAHALDKDTAIAVQRLLGDGVKAEVSTLYQAIQRSNSSLKRRPKRVLEDSIERVLTQLDIDDGSDSEASLDQEGDSNLPDADVMNRALRMNLASQQQSRTSTPPPTQQDKSSDSAARKRRTNGEALPKRQKVAESAPMPPADVSILDLGEMPEVLKQFIDLLVSPLSLAADYRRIGLTLPRGILLHGPPGCGKTTITRAFASALGLPFVQIQGPSIVSGMSGESEKGIREKFSEAKKHAPCLLFIDEIDAIAPKRETSQSQMEKRIVAQLLLSMDDLGEDDTAPVIVLAATNRPDSLDPALRRGGRFGAEICIGVPNEAMRASILKAQTRRMTLSPDVDFKVLAKSTAGFVGADLKDLVDRAGNWQMQGLKEAYIQQANQLQGTPSDADANLNEKCLNVINALTWRAKQKDLPRPAGFEQSAVSMQAFLAVLPGITPSSKREGFATIPNVSWADVGALDNVRAQLEMAVVQPIVNPERFANVGLSAPTGVLLCGPPGCGKTLLAKAVAAESKANFISVKGPELLDKYVGESEAAVRRLFGRARASAPCIIFFDELDALAPRRDGSASEASARVVNMLLTELDGLGDRGDVFVIGATNRPDIIDEAMMRPGRFETPLFVDLPGPDERVEILKTIFRAKRVQLEYAEIARNEACTGFTGADLRALWTKAAQQTVQRGGDAVSEADLQVALAATQRSVLDPGRYEAMKRRFHRRA